MEAVVYRIWLQQALGEGAPQSEAVLRFAADAQIVYGMTSFPDEWMLTAAQKKALLNKGLTRAQRIAEQTAENGGWFLTPEDELYTALFEGMYAPPVVLYAKGARPDVQEHPCIAIVGTRHHDENGRRITRQLAAGLAAGGALIVSGGAVGLDSEALDAALDEQGVCISFQACGIDINYPQATSSLRERLLASGGLLLTEFAVGKPAYRHHFRIRNRLISAAADGTLVTQAPRGSGALITAGWAREQGRDVYAVPGAVGVPCSEGSNDLLKDGAQLVTNAADILMNYVERYPFSLHFDAASAAEKRARQIRRATPMQIGQNATREEPAVNRVAQEATPVTRPVSCPQEADEAGKRVYEALVNAPQTVSELARALGMSSAEVLSVLTELELYGAVTCTAGQRYALKTE